MKTIRNPYLKNKSFVVTANREPIPGNTNLTRHSSFQNRSSEPVVGSNGEFNASSKKEALQAIATLQKQFQSGQIEGEEKSRNQQLREVLAERKEMIQAAVANKNGPEWLALGEVFGEEITTVGDREGWAGNLLLTKNLGAGDIPRFKVKTKQVSAWHAVSPSQVIPSHIRQDYVYPEEFYITANIRIEDKEIAQNPGDILEEKYGEGLEQTMVVEDRIMKLGLDKAAATSNDLFYFNTFSPTALQSMKTQVVYRGLTAANMIISFDIWDDIIADAEFSAWFDQVTKHDIVLTGALGSILGINIITDGFREQHLKVLDPGEVYILGLPNELGGITRRGEIMVEPTKGYNEGLPWRGWFFERIMALQIINSYAVVRGIRT